MAADGLFLDGLPADEDVIGSFATEDQFQAFFENFRGGEAFLSPVHFRDSEVKRRVKHPPQGLLKTLARGIGAEGRLGVEIVPEEDFFRGNDPVEALLDVFELVDVRKDAAAVDGNFDVTVGVGLLRKEMGVLSDLLYDQVKIGPRLLEGILPLLLTASMSRRKRWGVPSMIWSMAQSLTSKMMRPTSSE